MSNKSITVVTSHPQINTPAFYCQLVLSEELSNNAIKTHQILRLQKLIKSLYACARAAETGALRDEFNGKMAYIAVLTKRIKGVIWPSDFNMFSLN